MTDKEKTQEEIRKELRRKIELQIAREQVYLPLEVGPNCQVFLPPLDYINTPRGIVLRPGSGHSA